MENKTYIKLDNEHSYIPTQAYEGDAGYDIYINDSVILAPGETRDIPTGVRVKLPAGYWGFLTGRSSSIRKGLDVVNGIIDNGYTGELFVAVRNLSHQSVRLSSGTRLAQFILMPIVKTEFEQVEVLPSTEREEKGFGSSGE